MPEDVRTILTFSHVALRAFGKMSAALSAEAENVSARVEAVCISLEGITAYTNSRAAVIADLDTQIVEMLSAEEDGGDMPIVSFNSYWNAKEFLVLLPANIPDPEVAIEPGDGAISLEWHFGYRRVFAVSVGQGRRIAFAGINGTDRVHGVAEFDEKQGVPPRKVLEEVGSIARWPR
jgi:hypothetical protein